MFVKFDLIICGRQSIDGDTAQVGPQIAEKLNWPQLCYVEEVKSLENGKIVVLIRHLFAFLSICRLLQTRVHDGPQ